MTVVGFTPAAAGIARPPPASFVKSTNLLVELVFTSTLSEPAIVKPSGRPTACAGTARVDRGVGVPCAVLQDREPSWRFES